jgi:hypothetical protein
MPDDWRGDLEVWLSPFLAALGHKSRVRLWPAVYCRPDWPG